MAVSQAKEARPLVELPQVRPNHLRSFFDGRREIVVSLHTRDEGQARARVLARLRPRRRFNARGNSFTRWW